MSERRRSTSERRPSTSGTKLCTTAICIHTHTYTLSHTPHTHHTHTLHIHTHTYSSGTELGTTGRQSTLRCRLLTLGHRRSTSVCQPVLIGPINAPTSTVDALMSTLLQVDSCASTVDAYASTETLTLSPSSLTHPHSHTQVR